MENKNPDLGKTSTGLPANVAALLCYAAGVATGIIFFLIEKENKFVRFHAVQSMTVFGTLFLLQLVFPVVIPFLGWLVLPILSVLGVILWIVLMIKAYQGEKFKLPVAGDFAEQKSAG